jgi:cell division protein FtsW (lipid II flippase)
LVATRFVLVFDIFILFLSLGAVWLTVGDPQSGFPNGYTAFGVATMVGGYVGGQQVNPSNYTQSDYDAYTQAVLPPLMVGSWELGVALIALPVALVLALVSFARWQLLLPAGILAVVGCVLWIGGISAIAQEAGNRLAEWQGFGGATLQESVGPGFGPYIAVVGGISLLITYFLTKGGKLDSPLDSAPNPAS